MSIDICPFCGAHLFTVSSGDKSQDPGRRGCCDSCGARGPWRMEVAVELRTALGVGE